jgi:hypothetical protein
MAQRTDRNIESDHGFAPRTWVLDRDRVQYIWHETAEVFGNKLWVESMLGNDSGFTPEWRQEMARRKGGDFFDVLVEACSGLGNDDDPSLVFLALQETFGRYSVTLELEPHPWHGDVIARALRLREAGHTRPDYPPVTWRLDEDRVVSLWDDIENEGPESAVEFMLDDQEADELTLRGEIEVGIALESAVEHLDEEADPSLTFLALHAYFRDPYNGNVTFEFAPHPEHGDVLQRARRIRGEPDEADDAGAADDGAADDDDADDNDD